MLTQWPPADMMMGVLRIAALFGLAQGFGLVMHFLCAGPTLVGEILAGFTLGPMLLDQVTQVEELQVLGQIALMVVLFERGLYTNFASIAQCGAFGALMAILGCTLSMLLVVVALRINKVPFIESMCGGCIMSASVVGVVDIGWSRRQVKDINPCSSLVSKVIDAGTTFSAIFMLATVTVLRNIDPQSKWYHPVTEWWVVCQPMLFSLAFFLGSSFLRLLYSFFCLKDVMGRFFPPKNDPVNELYNAFEFAQVTFMTAFAIAMGVAAEVVKVPAIVGIFTAGMCFGGSETCRESWDRNTRNLTHWLSRVFFTCSIGFLMPKGMAAREAVLDGWEVASAAFFGSFIGGALGSLPVLLKEKSPVSNIILAGSAMAYSGELGFILLLEFWNAGYLSESTLNSLMWGLLLSTVAAPALCQLCVFVQVDTNSAVGEKTPANPNGSQLTGDQDVSNKYKLPDELNVGGGASGMSGAGNGTLMKSAEKSPGPFRHGAMETKASQLRNNMQYSTPEDKEREAPLLYNGYNPSTPFAYTTANSTTGYGQYVPSPKEPSPTQAPMGPAAGTARAAAYGGSTGASQIIQPRLQANGTRSIAPPAPGSNEKDLPPTLQGQYPSPTAPLETSPTTTSPAYRAPPLLAAVPINSQMRRTVPSIWADDD